MRRWSSSFLIDTDRDDMKEMLREVRSDVREIRSLLSQPTH